MARRNLDLSTEELEILTLLCQDADERGRFEFEQDRFAYLSHFIQMQYALARREDTQVPA